MKQNSSCMENTSRFTQVLSQYTPMIYKIMRQLHVVYDEEDFFAEGSLALYEAFLNFNDEKGDFSAYAFSCIRGKMLKKIAKEASAQTEALELYSETIAIPDADWETNIFIKQVFDSLSRTEQQLFILVFIQDLPISVAVTEASINLTYRQGKYMVKGIRETFRRAWQK